MLWYEVVGNVLYYITFPIVKLVFLVIYILRTLLSPFIYIVSTFVRLCLIPYNIAARLEPVWYYIGSAIIVGLVSALVLHSIFRVFVLVFDLDNKKVLNAKDKPATGHSVKSYRTARERRKTQAEKEELELEARARSLASSPLVKDALKQMQKEETYSSPGSGKSRSQRILLDQTIIEHSAEEDS